MNWTDEQEAIFNSVSNIKINAIAGSGKTSVLVEYCRRRPEKKFLYLVFNASAKDDAIKKFDDAGVKNVEIQTTHGLAYKNIVIPNGYRLKNNYSAYEIKNILNLEGFGYFGFILATHINKIMEKYFNSNIKDVDGIREVYKNALVTPDSVKFYDEYEDEIMIGVKKLIDDMRNNIINVTHSFYLKEFQLRDPILHYDCILVDEFQDTNHVLMDIFSKQTCQKVCVGDTHQQVYSWRGSINSLEKVDFEEFLLSKSFRFGQDISDIAMNVLDMKKRIYDDFESVNIIGHEHDKRDIRTHAVLSRSNLGLLKEAMDDIDCGVKHIYFEGDLRNYTFMSGISMYDVYNLYYGNRKYIRNPLIKTMKNTSELDEYIKKTDDTNLKMLVGIVNKFGRALPAKFKRLNEINLPKEERHKAEVVYSTVHKAKGLAFDSVKILDGFITGHDLEEQFSNNKVNKLKVNEEINILYVAITRAKYELILDSEYDFLK